MTGSAPQGDGRSLHSIRDEIEDKRERVQGEGRASHFLWRKGWRMTGSAPRVLDVALGLFLLEILRGGPGGDWRSIETRRKG